VTKIYPRSNLVLGLNKVYTTWSILNIRPWFQSTMAYPVAPAQRWRTHTATEWTGLAQRGWTECRTAGLAVPGLGAGSDMGGMCATWRTGGTGSLVLAVHRSVTQRMEFNITTSHDLVTSHMMMALLKSLWNSTKQNLSILIFFHKTYILTDEQSD